jgi:MFS transporter, MHS family, shikimate and dehydroshikimate transport protein
MYSMDISRFLNDRASDGNSTKTSFKNIGLVTTVNPSWSAETRKAVRTTLLSAVLGTAVEWYDFYLYATAAAIVFDKLFFPSYEPLTGTLLSYATFAVGFFVRPLGSVLFGRLGDHVGRKRVLVITLLVMGGSTTLIGFLPTYSQAGLLAPLLLVLLRIGQGLGSGAEYAGAVLMAVECAPDDKRGLYGSIPYIGVAAGLLLSLAAFSFPSRLPAEQFESWGWRIPFLLSSVVLSFGLFLRRSLKETPIFNELAQKGAISRSPIGEVFHVARRSLFCTWGARLGDNSLAYIYESFVIVYCTKQLSLPRPEIIAALMVSSAAQFITVPLFGWLSDQVGRKPVYIAGALLSGAFVFPFFAMLQTRSRPQVFLALLIASGVAKTLMTAAQSPWLAEMFPSRVRYTGFALAREVTSPISGGVAPLIATGLLAMGSGSPHLVSWYVVGLAAITTIAVALGPETRQRSLRDEDPL